MQVETCYKIDYLQSQYEDLGQIFLGIPSRSKKFKPEELFGVLSVVLPTLYCHLLQERDLRNAIHELKTFPVRATKI